MPSRQDVRTSVIRPAAMANADDLNGTVAMLAVDNAPSAHTEPEQGRIEAFELVNIASFGFQKAVERLQ
jgi:hypothetical protein